MRQGSIYGGRRDCFIEEPVRPEFSGCKMKSQLAVPRITRGLKRSLLVNAALVVCAVTAMAQNPGGSGAVVNPTTVSRNRQMARHPAIAAEPAATLAELPPDTPVVTLMGVCEPAGKSESKDCKTVITRGQMDTIVALMAPGAPLLPHRQMAIDYVRMLAASKLATDRKLEQNPAAAVGLQGQNELARLQSLTKAFYRQLEENAANPTMAEMQQYYAGHPSEFEEGEVWRLSIPYLRQSKEGMRIDPAMLKAELNGLRNLLVIGYDFDQVQVQAYKDLGIKQTPPPTKLTMARRSNMPPDQAKVFDLQPGEFTPVIDSFTQFVILELVSKRTAALESVVSEIKENLKPARFRQELQNASSGVTAEFNLKYLGLSAQPALFSPLISAYSFGPGGTSPDSRKRTASRRPTANPAPSTRQPHTQSSPLE